MNEAYVSSQRTTVMKTIVSLFSKVSQQRYYVRRGPINWAGFNFDTHPFAVSVNCDDTSILRNNLQTMIVSVEIMMKMLPENQTVKDQTIDDAGLDKLFEDLETVMAQLEGEMQQGMQITDEDNVVASLNRESDKVVEISDSMQGIQGIWGAFMIDY